MRRLSLYVFVLAMLLGMSSMTSVVAQGETPESLQQEATPQIGTLTFPLTPDPALCTIEPRSTEDLLGLWFTEDGTPVTITQQVPAEVTIPLGPAADDEEISAIYGFMPPSMSSSPALPPVTSRGRPHSSPMTWRSSSALDPRRPRKRSRRCWRPSRYRSPQR